jgi:hypothetical protein
MRLLPTPAKIRIPLSVVTLSLIGGAVALAPPLGNLREMSRGKPLDLAAALASTRTYQEGSRLYLDNGTVKVGLETKWGGAITEIVWHGMNFVNDFDNGREIQVAVYDGNPDPRCGDCQGANGWDPVQGGDHHKNGSPVVEQTLGKDALYTKTSPYHWVPENKGGSKEKPLPADVFIEQWVSTLPEYPSAVKLHYKISHFGKDAHTNTFQEFPAVYVNWEFGRFVYYGGEAPWTNGPVSFYTMPDLPKTGPPLYDPEQWGAFVNDQGIGLTVFVPGQYPYVSGFQRPPDAAKNSGARYFFPRVPFSFGPNSVLEGDAYLFAGGYQAARQAVYLLHKSIPLRDFLPPYGFVEHPKPQSNLSGAIDIGGWAIDDTQVSQVKIFVDERPVGTATYGLPRPDVSKIWPHVPTEVGFSYKLDTTKYPNGVHVLGINAEDKAGNVAILNRISVLINNSKEPNKPQ